MKERGTAGLPYQRPELDKGGSSDVLDMTHSF